MAEMTVYLRYDYKGHGLGRLLYTKLENILQKQGVVKTIALITVPPTEEEKSIYGSMFFHEKWAITLPVVWKAAATSSIAGMIRY